MPEWIQIITSKTSISVAFTVAWTVLYIVSDLSTGIYLVVLSFMLAFLSFEPIKQFLSSYNKANQFSTKLHELSEPEKAIIKRFLDEDRRELKLKWSDDHVERLEEKKIISNSSQVIGFVSGEYDESDEWSEFTIQDAYFQVAKKNYQTIFGVQ